MLKNLRLKLIAAVFVLSVISLAALSLLFLPVGKLALALSPNYSKTTGAQLSATEWNNLPSDFVARTGGSASAMQGVLDMGNNLIQNIANPTNNNDAVNLLTLNSRFGGGSGKKIFCGETLGGSTNWQQWGTSQVTIFVNVDTSSAGFASEPIYISNMGGTGNHFMTLGTQSVYSTTPTGFTVYITKTTTPTIPLTNLMVDTLTPTLANSWGWHIHWCGIGN